MAAADEAVAPGLPVVEPGVDHGLPGIEPRDQVVFVFALDQSAELRVQSLPLFGAECGLHGLQRARVRRAASDGACKAGVGDGMEQEG